jgi:hypothetical protein
MIGPADKFLHNIEVVEHSHDSIHPVLASCFSFASDLTFDCVFNLDVYFVCSLAVKHCFTEVPDFRRHVVRADFELEKSKV